MTRCINFPSDGSRVLFILYPINVFIVSRCVDQAYTHFDSGKYLGRLEVCSQRVDGGGLLTQVVVKI